MINSDISLSTFFAVSIGYWENGKVIFGVVFKTIRKNLFYTEKGAGAFLNGEKIKVSSTKSLINNLLVTGWAYNKDKISGIIDEVKNILKFTEFLSLGSVALELCYVASGIFDEYWEYSLCPWDLAAGILIAEEAGAIISTLSRKDFDLFKGGVLVIIPNLKREFTELIRKKILEI